MITKDRTKVSPSAEWKKKAKDETKRICKIAKKGQDWDSELYKDASVKEALRNLFDQKCAYCESALTADWDVEHYRPKKKVKECPEHPGYYWLAAVWPNLYPACTHCNQLRLDPADPKSPARGKGTHFPLENESDRAGSPKDDLRLERPLLLDPCELGLDPDEHIGFRPNGEIFGRSERGKATINLCHLDRSSLTQFTREMVDRAKLIYMVDKKAPEIAEEYLMVVSKSPHFGVLRYVLNHPGDFGL